MDAVTIYAIIILIILPLALNAIATYIVLNTYFIVKGRRSLQLLVIWLIPFIGAALAIYTNREDYFDQKRKRQIGNNTAFTNADETQHYIGANHRGGR